MAAAKPKPPQSVLSAAGNQAARLERLILAAQRFAAALAQGQYSRRRAGRGENFWQFRQYQPGEETAAIDWRRSARDTELYVREKEQDTAQTLFLIPDLSGSMLYRSDRALASKEERALLWLFVLAELGAKSGDRLAVPNLLKPRLDRAMAQTLAAALARDKTYPAQSGFNADFSALPRYAHIVIISDFLDDAAKIERIMLRLAERQAQIKLIAVADPAEITFPFSGDTEFEDPETGEALSFGQAQNLRADYVKAYQAHSVWLEKLAARAQARLMQDRTDIPPEKKLEQLAALWQT